MKFRNYKLLPTLLFCASVAAQSGSTVFVDEAGPTVVAQEGPLVPTNYSWPLFNDYGFVIRGNTTSGEEFSLWMFMYRQIGEEEFIINEDLCQTAMIYGVFSASQKATMHDTPFINVGQDIEDYKPVGTIKNSENNTKAKWTFEGLFFTSEEKKWNVRGTHGGVTVCLEMTQRGEEFYHAGLFSALSGCSNNTTSSNYNCSGVAGGIVHFDVTGTMNANGTNLTIHTAYGVHERIIQAGSVPSRLEASSGTGALWLHGWGKELSYFIFTAAQGPYAVGMLNADNQTIVTSGVPSASIETVGNWLDPKTNQVNPYSWHAFANLDTGRLDSTVTAFGRLYYYWVRNGGMILVHQYIADCQTTFTRKDGSVVQEHGVAFLEYMRTLYTQPKS